MQLFDKERTLISLDNVTHINSRSDDACKEYVLMVWYIGGGGFGYNYNDKKTLEGDQEAIGKWLGKKERKCLEVHLERLERPFTDARGKDYVL